MLPWEALAESIAPDGKKLELRRRGREYLIKAGGHELMSSEDDASSRSLAELGCKHLPARDARVLVGGLGMGFTLRAALDALPKGGSVEIAELVPAVVEWNRGVLAELAGKPLDDPRTILFLGDVRLRIKQARAEFDAILLDVDNGPSALAHEANTAIYSGRGLSFAWEALRPGGVLGVWSISDDQAFTRRLERQGFSVKVERVHGSRKGRGKLHVIWVARKPLRG